jgi:ADP-ribose pyrophosphatase YjhB (NUDIX family)
MNNQFIYCPYCGTHLIEQNRFGQIRPSCTNCGFVHFQDPKVAVIALVINQGKVLLVRRAVDPAKGKWALPGGYMDAGEMPASALQRELREEVNLSVQIDRLLHIYPMADGSGARRGIVLAYAARLTPGSRDGIQVGDDVDQAGWFAPGEIPDNLAFESTKDLLAEWLPA